MLFTDDVRTGLLGAAALVNTQSWLSDSERDELATTGDLDAFVRSWSYSGPRTGSRAELESVRALRPRLHALWTSGSTAAAVGLVNGMLRDGDARPQLVEHDGQGWHVHATRPEAPLADRIMVESAMAWLDVLRSGERARMAVCGATDCDAVLVDLSRNRSKRFCDVGNCGNRTNVQAYRARRSAAAFES